MMVFALRVHATNPNVVWLWTELRAVGKYFIHCGRRHCSRWHVSQGTDGCVVEAQLVLHVTHHVPNNASWLIQRPSLVNFWLCSLIFFSSPTSPHHPRINLLCVARTVSLSVVHHHCATHVDDFLHKRIIAFQPLMPQFQPISPTRATWLFDVICANER